MIRTSYQRTNTRVNIVNKNFRKKSDKGRNSSKWNKRNKTPVTQKQKDWLLFKKHKTP